MARFQKSDDSWLYLLALFAVWVYWRLRQQTTSTQTGARAGSNVQTGTGGAIVGGGGNTGGGLLPGSANPYNFVPLFNPPQSFAKWSMNHPGAVFDHGYDDIPGSVGTVPLGTLGSNIPWGLWDTYLGAPGGVDRSTGQFYNPIQAVGAPGTAGLDQGPFGAARLNFRPNNHGKL